MQKIATVGNPLKRFSRFPIVVEEKPNPNLK